jgi:hypothetical protein
MTADRASRFPSGTLVAGLLAGNGVLWAVMFFGPLAHLQALAGGAAPFDIRPLGYSYEEAGAFLEAIGEQGRAYYLRPELLLDTVYPPFYAVSRALALWWLTMPGRLYDGAVPQRWRWTLVAMPIVMATCDSVENVCIAKMLLSCPDLSPGLVQASSLATRVKFIAGVFTEILMAALAIPALLRWRRLPPSALPRGRRRGPQQAEVRLLPPRRNQRIPASPKSVGTSARALDGDEVVAIGGAASGGNDPRHVVAVDLSVRQRLRELACAAVRVRRRLAAGFAGREATVDAVAVGVVGDDENALVRFGGGSSKEDCRESGGRDHGTH